MNLVTLIAVRTTRVISNWLGVRVSSHCRLTPLMSTLDTAASAGRGADDTPSAARPIDEPADFSCHGDAGGLIIQSSDVEGSIDHVVDGEAADSVSDRQTEDSTRGQTMGSVDGKTQVSFVGQTKISSDGLTKVSSDVGSTDVNESVKSSDCESAPSAEDSESANSARASSDKAPPIDGSSAGNIDSLKSSPSDDSAQLGQELVSNLSLDKRKREEDDESPELKKAKLETKALKAKRPGFTDERYTETSYWFENGLRKVYPYYFTFTTFTKGRWVGEKILDVFAREFRAHPAKEYERCIKAGTLTVNYQKVDIDHRLRHNDLLANVVHRHEVPITDSRVPIVHLDDHLVVVDKPSSIPVHPCGRYRHNTVVFILAKEHGLKNLRTVHRLDRLTSGLLMFGRTTAKARDMEQQIRSRQVTKEYVCRVEGEFPSEPIVCKLPVEVVSYKIGVCKVSPKGKECLTEFRRISYNGTESVVSCHPHTGRMHQIRVHLQYLGYPIVNDPLYNHTVFGANKGKGGVIDKSDEQLIADLISIHNAENWLGTDGDEQMGAQHPNAAAVSSDDITGVTSADCSAVPPSAGRCQVNQLTASVIDRPQSDSTSPATEINGKTNGDGLARYQTDLMSLDEHCYECKVRYRDPRPCDLVMYLHALKYSGPGWSYETAMPDWAREDWTSPEEENV